MTAEDKCFRRHGPRKPDAKACQAALLKGQRSYLRPVEISAAEEDHVGFSSRGVAQLQERGHGQGGCAFDEESLIAGQDAQGVKDLGLRANDHLVCNGLRQGQGQRAFVDPACHAVRQRNEVIALNDAPRPHRQGQCLRRFGSGTDYARGAVASLALCRPDAKRFLIVGSGTQAFWLARALRHLAPAAEIAIWGRNPDRALALVARLADAKVALDLEAACHSADVIVTATPATAPLIRASWVRPGCHITAIGADSPGKQELETELVARAQLRVADSLSQSLDHGEFAHAHAAGLIGPADCTELGAILSGQVPGRRNPDDITIADLTGVATQDIAMARCVLSRAKEASR